MRRLALATIFALSSLLVKELLAQEARPGMPIEPHANTEEGPFGGPPPSRRGKRGTKCITAQTTCSVDPPKPVGEPCICIIEAVGQSKGKVE